MRVIHPFPPLVGADSRALILGSFPSERSRAEGFFYGHPQNRFWRVLAAVYGADAPQSVAEKRDFILSRRLALWDVIAECDIEGSADASIGGVVPNDIGKLMRDAPITRVFTNGGTAFRLYKKYILPDTGAAASRLPSTSSANAGWSAERMIEAWRVVASEGNQS
ncbi:MAG: DNA-deoxyinosine glycosylase [Clostridiales bacterium]|jgi:hypoxanthine-DNA glycosylase|nr:DNA-deoxyinosine glycosylase [Clostridiales bacterium]